MRKYILMIMLFSVSFTYEVGEIITVNHQNLSKTTCFEGNGYSIDDEWALADWNGDLNGGNYNVIFLEMSATW